jgi:hypothetical protein
VFWQTPPALHVSIVHGSPSSHWVALVQAAPASSDGMPPVASPQPANKASPEPRTTAKSASTDAARESLSRPRLVSVRRAARPAADPSTGG